MSGREGREEGTGGIRSGRLLGDIYRGAKWPEDSLQGRGKPSWWATPVDGPSDDASGQPVDSPVDSGQPGGQPGGQPPGGQRPGDREATPRPRASKLWLMGTVSMANEAGETFSFLLFYLLL